jgi:hypothetical protein
MSGNERANGARLEAHPMYTPSDLAYLRGKGYDDAEIRAIWDRDRARGCEPLVHRPPPDVIGPIIEQIKREEQQRQQRNA